MMNLFFTVFGICIIISKMEGLEMDLDLNTPTSSDHRPVCGVLTCEESFTSNTSNNSTTSASSSHRRTISSMRIFKVSQNKLTRVSSEGGDKRLVTELTLERPRVARVSDGVKVDGELQAQRARLRLELVRQADCLAPYTCQVTTDDGQGNEVVHTSRLRAQSKTDESEAGGTAMMPGVLLQQLALLQQQMTYMGASLEGKIGALESSLEEKIGALESRSVDKMKDLQKEITEKFETFDRKFQDIESRFDTVQSRLEDKIETRVVDKLCQLEMKLPGIEDEAHQSTHYIDQIRECFKSYKEEMKDENGLVLSNFTSVIVSTIQGHMTDILTLEQRNQLKFNDLILASDKLINSSEMLGQRVQNDFSALQNNLKTDFDQLKTGVQTRSLETLSAVQDLISDTNSTMWNSLKPVLLDILIPKECKKGMFPSLLGTAFPYHVIEPSGESEPDGPYLCDSLTAGGGWIVIQRRVSGDVDFYRGWADYKQGFGTLYGDFWWGNEKIHALTNSGRYELRVDLKYKGKSGFAHYSSFSLDGENNNYVLRLGTYDGTAGDALSFHRGNPFSTHDRDNDGSSRNEAVKYFGAWWYDGHRSNLNAKWSISDDVKAARWVTFSDLDSVSFSEMKIRRV